MMRKLSKELGDCDIRRAQKAGDDREDTAFLNKMVSEWGTFFFGVLYSHYVCFFFKLLSHTL